MTKTMHEVNRQSIFSSVRLISQPVQRTVLLLCAATLAGFGGGLWWPFELASHFRVQYAVLLVAGVVVLAVAGKSAWAWIALLCAGMNLGVIVPLYVRDSAQVGGHSSFRVVSINVSRSSRAYEKVIQFIQSSEPDVFLLMEVTHGWLIRLAPLSASYPHSIAQPREDNFGMAFFSRTPFGHARIEHGRTSDFPIVIASLVFNGKPLNAIHRLREEVPGSTGVGTKTPEKMSVSASGDSSVTIIGAHPPPPISRGFMREREQYLGEVREYVSLQKGPSLVIGDLNTTSWSPLFTTLVQLTDLRDSRRGFGIQATWPAAIPPFLIPIDHCLVSRQLQVINRQVGPNVGSDHYPVIVDLAVR